MFGGWSEWLGWLACMLLTGAVIKLMDDSLDAAFDKFRGKRTLAVRLGSAVFPYGLMLALLAANIDVKLTLALFFGSYAVGMFTNWRERLPSHLPAYVEMLLAVGSSVLLTGWQLALWAIAMMAVIDWLDDLVDVAGDKRSGQANLAVRIGFVETLFLVMGMLCVAVLLDPVRTVLAFVAVTLLSIGAEATTKRLWSVHDEKEGVES